MRRFTLALFAAIMAAMMICPQAQAAKRGNARVGIMGGFTSSSARAKDLDATTIGRYHIGVSAQLPIALGFSIQPGLLYTAKGTKLSEANLGNFSLDTQVSYLEIPVQLQWGPDLLAFRPYAFVEPFVGYGLKAVTKSEVFNLQTNSFRNAALSRWEYGLGLGVGVDVWKLQVSAKYYWNFGSLYNESGQMEPIGQTVKNAFKDGRNFNGITFSLAFFF